MQYKGGCHEAIALSQKQRTQLFNAPTSSQLSSKFFRSRLRAGALVVGAISLIPLVASSKSEAFVHRSLSSLSSSISMTKLDSPSAQRNKGPIWQVLSSKVLPQIAAACNEPTDDREPIRILEVAAGSGVHTEAFAMELTNRIGSKSFLWYPTDPAIESLASIKCYIDDNQQLSNTVASPMPLTLNTSGIQESATFAALFPNQSSTLDLIICINMIHISPWSATLGLMKLAGQSLSASGCLYCYGPYKVGGAAAESNLNFDMSLKSRNPSWGVRDLETVLEAAAKEGLELKETIEMPANNLSLIFQRTPQGIEIRE